MFEMFTCGIPWEKIMCSTDVRAWRRSSMIIPTVFFASDPEAPQSLGKSVLLLGEKKNKYDVFLTSVEIMRDLRYKIYLGSDKFEFHQNFDEIKQRFVIYGFVLSTVVAPEHITLFQDNISKT